jgi:hypothetical protein
MVRTQIQLTEDQIERLRAMSMNRHESIASLIRKAVDLFILSGKPGKSALFRQAKTAVGKYTSDRTDVSLDHDRYLDEGYDR